MRRGSSSGRADSSGGRGTSDLRPDPSPGGANLRRLAANMCSVIRWFQADDHPGFRLGLRAMLAGEPELEFVGEAGDGDGAFRDIERIVPDIAILDIGMPRMSVFDIHIALQDAGLPTKTMILTGSEHADVLLRASQLRIPGFVRKDAEWHEISNAIKLVAKGAFYWSAAAAGAIPSTRAVSILTPKQLEVVRLFAQGMAVREIATALCIEETTVKTHLMGAQKRLDARNRQHLVLRAHEEGLVGG